jgi:hypothetical protein
MKELKKLSVSVVKAVVIADGYGNKNTYKTPRPPAKTIANDMVWRRIYAIHHSGGDVPSDERRNAMYTRTYRRVLKIMEKALS